MVSNFLSKQQCLFSYHLIVDVPIWSKQATGRIPALPELFEIIENQNKLFASDDSLQSIAGRLA